MKMSKRAMTALALAALTVIAMFAWDELWDLYEVAPVHARLLVYGLYLAFGWLGGTQLLRDDGSFKPLSESTFPSAYIPMIGASVFAEAVEKWLGVHWNTDALENFGRYFPVYSSGIACAVVHLYRRHSKPVASGT